MKTLFFPTLGYFYCQAEHSIPSTQANIPASSLKHTTKN